MKASPQVHSIYIAPLAGKPMMQLSRADIIAEHGIMGDRYAQGVGAFSKTKPKIRHISLIALSSIEDANRQLIAKQHSEFHESETRRNLVISGISGEELNSLVGKIFYVGGLAFKGTELCAPCQRPANLLGKSDFMNAFEDKGGLRAEALESGTLKQNDLLTFSLDKK